MSVHQAPRPSLRSLQRRAREGSKLVMLTAYDYVTAHLLERAGVDLILVGDSLGNVVLGHETTLPVTLDAMIHHASAVVRGARGTFVVVDLPFGTYFSPEEGVRSAIRVMRETGAQAVKIEGGIPVVETVRAITDQGIPVMAHIGLTPQSIHQLGGYYKHGKSDAEATDLLAAAKALEHAGAFSLVLEMVVPEVATQVTQSLAIPTIGIGSGGGTSGQVLVINDLIGLGVAPPPSFATPKADAAKLIGDAVAGFIEDVRQGTS